MIKNYCHLTYRVPFSETDAMGVVHHSNHPKYMERGRLEFLRLVGLGYDDVIKMGFHLPLTEMNIRYKRPLVFDDILLIETSVSTFSKTRIEFQYTIFKTTELSPVMNSQIPSKEKSLVTGSTNHCCVDLKGRPVDMSGPLLDAIEKMAGVPRNDHH